MNKSLSQLLEEIQPELKGTWHKLDNYYAECILPETKNTTSLVTLEDYDRMKRVAIELAKALEFYESCHVCSRCDSEIKSSALSRAKDIIGEVK